VLGNPEDTSDVRTSAGGALAHRRRWNQQSAHGQLHLVPVGGAAMLAAGDLHTACQALDSLFRTSCLTQTDR